MTAMIQTPAQAAALPGNAEHRERLRDLLAAIGITCVPRFTAKSPGERVRPFVTLTIRSDQTRRELRDAQPQQRISDEAAETFGVDLDVADEGTVQVAYSTDARIGFEDWLAWATRDVPAGYHVVGLRGERGIDVGWTPGTSDAAAELVDVRDELAAAEARVAELRARRDEAIVTAAGAGLTAYRTAKVLRVAESTVGRVLAREDRA